MAVAGAAACAYGAWLALAGGLSYFWFLKGEFARARLEPEAAAAAVGRAVRWDAANAQPHLGLGNVKLAAVFGLGRVYEAMGDPDAALQEFRRAAAWQRRHVFYREQLGVHLRRAGREAEALDVFRQNAADGVASEVTTLNLRALERKLARPPDPAPAAP